MKRIDHKVSTSEQREQASAIAHWFLADQPVRVKAATEDHGLTIIGIGSTEMEDLEGDVVHKSALEDLCAPVDPDDAQGKNCFCDHRYTTEWLLGGLAEAPALTTIQHKGKTMAGVQAAIAVWEDNPNAMLSVKAVQSKAVTLALSIGMEVRDYEIRKDAHGLMTGLDIHHVKRMEWSTTPWPANPSCIAHTVAKSLAKQGLIPKRQDEREFAYVVRNWSDFVGDDDLTANALRRLNLALNKHGLAIAKLNEVAA